MKNTLILPGLIILIYLTVPTISLIDGLLKVPVEILENIFLGANHNQIDELDFDYNTMVNFNFGQHGNWLFGRWPDYYPWSGKYIDQYKIWSKQGGTNISFRDLFDLVMKQWRLRNSNSAKWMVKMMLQFLTIDVQKTKSPISFGTIPAEIKLKFHYRKPSYTWFMELLMNLQNNFNDNKYDQSIKTLLDIIFGKVKLLSAGTVPDDKFNLIIDGRKVPISIQNMGEQLTIFFKEKFQRFEHSTTQWFLNIFLRYLFSSNSEQYEEQMVPNDISLIFLDAKRMKPEILVFYLIDEIIKNGQSHVLKPEIIKVVKVVYEKLKKKNPELLKYDILKWVVYNEKYVAIGHDGNPISTIKPIRINEQSPVIKKWVNIKGIPTPLGLNGKLMLVEKLPKIMKWIVSDGKYFPIGENSEVEMPIVSLKPGERTSFVINWKVNNGINIPVGPDNTSETIIFIKKWVLKNDQIVAIGTNGREIEEIRPITLGQINNFIKWKPSKQGPKPYGPNGNPIILEEVTTPHPIIKISKWIVINNKYIPLNAAGIPISYVRPLSPGETNTLVTWIKVNNKEIPIALDGTRSEIKIVDRLVQIYDKYVAVDSVGNPIPEIPLLIPGDKNPFVSWISKEQGKKPIGPDGKPIIVEEKITINPTIRIIRWIVIKNKFYAIGLNSKLLPGINPLSPGERHDIISWEYKDGKSIPVGKDGSRHPIFILTKLQFIDGKYIPLDQNNQRISDIKVFETEENPFIKWIILDDIKISIGPDGNEFPIEINKIDINRWIVINGKYFPIGKDNKPIPGLKPLKHGEKHLYIKWITKNGNQIPTTLEGIESPVIILSKFIVENGIYIPVDENEDPIPSLPPLKNGERNGLIHWKIISNMTKPFGPDENEILVEERRNNYNNVTIVHWIVINGIYFPIGENNSPIYEIKPLNLGENHPFVLWITENGKKIPVTSKGIRYPIFIIKKFVIANGTYIAVDEKGHLIPEILSIKPGEKNPFIFWSITENGTKPIGPDGHEIIVEEELNPYKNVTIIRWVVINENYIPIGEDGKPIPGIKPLKPGEKFSYVIWIRENGKQVPLTGDGLKLPVYIIIKFIIENGMYIAIDSKGNKIPGISPLIPGQKNPFIFWSITNNGTKPIGPDGIEIHVEEESNTNSNVTIISWIVINDNYIPIGNDGKPLSGVKPLKPGERFPFVVWIKENGTQIPITSQGLKLPVSIVIKFVIENGKYIAIDKNGNTISGFPPLIPGERNPFIHWTITSNGTNVIGPDGIEILVEEKLTIPDNIIIIYWLVINGKYIPIGNDSKPIPAIRPLNPGEKNSFVIWIKENGKYVPTTNNGLKLPVINIIKFVIKNGTYVAVNENGQLIPDILSIKPGEKNPFIFWSITQNGTKPIGPDNHEIIVEEELNPYKNVTIIRWVVINENYIPIGEDGKPISDITPLKPGEKFPNVIWIRENGIDIPVTSDGLKIPVYFVIKFVIENGKYVALDKKGNKIPGISPLIPGEKNPFILWSITNYGPKPLGPDGHGIIVEENINAFNNVTIVYWIVINGKYFPIGEDGNLISGISPLNLGEKKTFVTWIREDGKLMPATTDGNKLPLFIVIKFLIKSGKYVAVDNKNKQIPGIPPLKPGEKTPFIFWTITNIGKIPIGLDGHKIPIEDETNIFNNQTIISWIVINENYMPIIKDGKPLAGVKPLKPGEKYPFGTWISESGKLIPITTNGLKLPITILIKFVMENGKYIAVDNKGEKIPIIPPLLSGESNSFISWTTNHNVTKPISLDGLEIPVEVKISVHNNMTIIQWIVINGMFIPIGKNSTPISGIKPLKLGEPSPYIMWINDNGIQIPVTHDGIKAPIIFLSKMVIENGMYVALDVRCNKIPGLNSLIPGEQNPFIYWSNTNNSIKPIGPDGFEINVEAQGNNFNNMTIIRWIVINDKYIPIGEDGKPIPYIKPLEPGEKNHCLFWINENGKQIPVTPDGGKKPVFTISKIVFENGKYVSVDKNGKPIPGIPFLKPGEKNSFIYWVMTKSGPKPVGPDGIEIYVEDRESTDNIMTIARTTPYPQIKISRWIVINGKFYPAGLNTTRIQGFGPISPGHINSIATWITQNGKQIPITSDGLQLPISIIENFVLEKGIYFAVDPKGDLVPDFPQLRPGEENDFVSWRSSVDGYILWDLEGNPIKVITKTTSLPEILKWILINDKYIPIGLYGNHTLNLNPVKAGELNPYIIKWILVNGKSVPIGVNGKPMLVEEPTDDTPIPPNTVIWKIVNGKYVAIDSDSNILHFKTIYGPENLQELQKILWFRYGNKYSEIYKWLTPLFSILVTINPVNQSLSSKYILDAPKDILQLLPLPESRKEDVLLNWLQQILLKLTNHTPGVELQFGFLKYIQAFIDTIEQLKLQVNRPIGILNFNGLSIEIDKNGKLILYDKNGNALYDLSKIPKEIQEGKFEMSQGQYHMIVNEHENMVGKNEEGFKWERNQTSGILDFNGISIILDEHGKPILYDKNGNPLYDLSKIPKEIQEGIFPIPGETWNMVGNKTTHFLTVNGMDIELDINGKPILYDKNGKPLYDLSQIPKEVQEGTFPIPERNSQIVENQMTPYINVNGVNIELDKNGKPILYDKNGNPLYDLSKIPKEVQEGTFPIPGKKS